MLTRNLNEKRTDITYVIGHVNPDTDAIASAMGYAWLLQDQSPGTILSARAGQLNPQTTWVLRKLDLDPPWSPGDRYVTPAWYMTGESTAKPISLATRAVSS
jgi:hypothetical protein